MKVFFSTNKNNKHNAGNVGGVREDWRCIRGYLYNEFSRSQWHFPKKMRYAQDSPGTRKLIKRLLDFLSFFFALFFFFFFSWSRKQEILYVQIRRLVDDSSSLLQLVSKVGLNMKILSQPNFYGRYPLIFSETNFNFCKKRRNLEILMNFAIKTF